MAAVGSVGLTGRERRSVGPTRMQCECKSDGCKSKTGRRERGNDRSRNFCTKNLYTSIYETCYNAIGEARKTFRRATGTGRPLGGFPSHGRSQHPTMRHRHPMAAWGNASEASWKTRAGHRCPPPRNFCRSRNLYTSIYGERLYNSVPVVSAQSRYMLS